MTPAPAKSLLAAGLALLLLVVLRAPSVSDVIWNPDEAHTSVTAQHILAGGLPYRDSVDQRPPLTYVVYAAIYAAGGRNDLRLLRGVLIVWIAAFLLVIGRVTRAWAGPGPVPYALLAGALICSVALRPGDGYAFHVEWVVILFTSCGAWALLDRRPQPPPLRLVLGGLCFGLAMLAKQPAAFDLLVALAFVAARAYWEAEHASPLRQAVQNVLLVGVAASTPLLLTAALFLAAGAWDELWFYTYTYNAEYYVKAIPLSFRLSQIPLHLRYVFLHTALVLPLVAVGLAVLVIRLRRGVPRERLAWELFPYAWLASSFAGACLSGRIFAHYYIAMFPALVMIGGLSLRTLLRLPVRPALGWKLSVWGGLILLAALRFADVQHYVPKYRNALDEAVAAHVRARSTLQDRLFVWGYRPELYTISDRDPGSRFSLCAWVIGYVAWKGWDEAEAERWVVPGSFEQLLGDLERTRPLYFVDASPGCDRGFRNFPPARYPALARLLEEHYEFERGIRTDNRGVLIYRRID